MHDRSVMMQKIAGSKRRPAGQPAVICTFLESRHWMGGEGGKKAKGDSWILFFIRWVYKPTVHLAMGSLYLNHAFNKLIFTFIHKLQTYNFPVGRAIKSLCFDKRTI